MTPADGATARFSSRRGIAPLLWALVALSAVELAVVHLLVALWSRRAAIVLSLVTIAALAWLVRGIRALATRPSRIVGDMLDLRSGTLARMRVPLADIARVTVTDTRARVRAPGVRNLALVAHPNVLVELRRPLGRGRRRWHGVAHRLDDPGAFVAALERLGVAV